LAEAATKEQQDKLVELLKTNKIRTILSPQSEYIADITGTSSPGINEKGPNGPPHKNVAAFMILLAEKHPGYVISSLGNNTHSNSGGWHNTKPLLAFDVADVNTGAGNIDNATSEQLAPFLKTMDESNLTLQLLVNPINYAKTKKAAGKLNVGLENGPNHFHISVAKDSIAGGGSTGGIGDCTYTDTNLPSRQDGQNIKDRLNKKSLTDTEWNLIQDKIKSGLSAEEFLKIGDNATLDSSQNKLLMFNSQVATDRAYNLAATAGYKNRKIANQADLNGGADGQALDKAASAAFKELVVAARKDGYTIEQKAGYRSPEYQRDTLFQVTFQRLCNETINANCSSADIASGKYDNLLTQRLTKSSLPYLSKHHTGLAIDVNQSGVEQLEQIASTELFKWMKDDNYFNLKRFGFIPSYPEGGTNMGPFPEPWEILYVGKDPLFNK
jgi:LAS superfamily LD-carboxypeptidase LdcB